MENKTPQMVSDVKKFMETPEGKRKMYLAWSTEDLSDLRNDLPSVEVLGLGHESFAIVDPDDPNTVITLPRGGSSHVPKGISPFSETYNIHRFLRVLFPENFPVIKEIRGFHARTTKRERVKVSGDKDFEHAAGSLSNKLNNLGISGYLDTGSEYNFALDGEGNLVYLDLFIGGAGDFSKVSIEKVNEVIENKYQAEGPEVINKKLQQASLYLRRLSELNMVNEIYDRLKETGLDTLKNYEPEINNFSFTGGDKTLDEMSRKKDYFFTDQSC